MKKIYKHRIKAGSSRLMAQVLKFPEQVDSRMDGKICRITVTSYTIKDNIKPSYQEKYKDEHLYQIEILDIPEKEFLVFACLLENLDEVVVVDNNSVKEN